MSKQEEIKQALELLHKGGAVPLNVVEAVNDLLEENELLRKMRDGLNEESLANFKTAADRGVENKRLRKELEEAKQALDTPKRNLLYMFQNERTQMENWRSQFHKIFSECERALEESGRLRKELEVKDSSIETLTKQITDEVAISAAAIVERDQLRKELEEARKIKFPRQADGEGGWVIDYKFLERLGVTMLRESDHTIDSEDIELVLLTLEIAVGQEGEGNQ
jgi:predicted RNase H-like nuclease (RuvC/YqgF family)